MYRFPSGTDANNFCLVEKHIYKGYHLLFCRVRTSPVLNWAQCQKITVTDLFHDKRETLYFDLCLHSFIPFLRQTFLEYTQGTDEDEKVSKAHMHIPAKETQK